MTDSEKRNDSRLPVSWRATVTTDDETSFPVEIRDVSLAGTLVASESELPIGTQLILNVDGLGEFAGEIRWTSEGTLGLTLIAGPDLLLKKFAEKAGADLSEVPEKPEEDVGP
ncbi:hypothetical protein GCM10017044_02790 [Kordiimonas sediminis]|uniref:PilZ domain-containing protein n=1 Tax=Kordiimonas sediminis TaxID=1735581 RepID=A0A919AK36_9PROT|nr:PilZ domain-containing protein [Kordiimonas sediminis]GHF12300.1 hypothetical protein GCM10017044_02790 [Kordiimonas sediminis]